MKISTNLIGNRSALTKVQAAVALIVIVIAIASGAYYYSTTVPQKPQEVEIDIGVLVDLSGPLTTYGEDIRNAVTICAEEINAYFGEKGDPYRVRLFIEDTKIDPKITLEKVQTLHGKGITLIVGPMGSGEVKQIAEYVTANKIVMVSPSSTAANEFLGITKPEERKYIFRFVALDTVQTDVITKEAAELGIKGVVIVNIGNAWGKGLKEFSKPKFESLGIEVKEAVEHPEPPPTDFTPNIAILETAVNELLQKYDKSQVAVVAYTYEEVYTMISQIDSESSLFDVRWLGCDGTAKSRRIDENPDRINKIGMYSTLFNPPTPKTATYEKLETIYHERFNRDIYQYALNAYDATWALALSYADVYGRLGKYDPDDMAGTIRAVTDKYTEGEYGMTTVSGYIALDEYNDRASGDFAIWGVENSQWVMKAIYNYAENKIEWQ